MSDFEQRFVDIRRDLERTLAQLADLQADALRAIPHRERRLWACPHCVKLSFPTEDALDDHLWNVHDIETAHRRETRLAEIGADE